MLRSKEDWEDAAPPDCIRQAQDPIGWARHFVIFHPLWLGCSMPALLKGFLEKVARPGFAVPKADAGHKGHKWKRLLAGRSARIVVTMGMPVLLYRWYFGAHILNSLERNILGFCGIGPIRESLIGLVEAANDTRRKKWLEKMRSLGGHSA